MSQETTSSHVLQASLRLSTSTNQYRRKIINSLQGNIAQLAMSIAGSHVVDALWIATQDKSMTVYRERIAEELVKEEESLRESKVGRNVWRNWKLDLYKRRKMDWLAKSNVSKNPLSRSANHSVSAPMVHGPEQRQVDRMQGNVQNAQRGKTGIELARAKFAARKAKDAAGEKMQRHVR
jgi:nucleolar protein 9